HAACRRMDDADRYLVRSELFECADDRFRRTLDIRLDQDRELLGPGFLQLAHHLFERDALTGRALELPPLALAIVGDVTGPRFVLDGREAVAGLRRTAQSQHLDRDRRSGLAHVLAAIVDECPYPAPLCAGDDHVTDAKRPALHQNGGNRPAAPVDLGLDDRALG